MKLLYRRILYPVGQLAQESSWLSCGVAIRLQAVKRDWARNLRENALFERQEEFAETEFLIWKTTLLILGA